MTAPTTKRQAKKERSRQAKAARRAAAVRARRLRRLRRLALPALIALVVVAGVAGIYRFSSSYRRTAATRINDFVTTEPNLGRTHTASTTDDPAPTSGPHDTGAICGVESGPVPAGAQIHSLEHGSVIYQYRGADVDPAGVGTLEQLARELGSHTLVAPNPDLDAPIVATAWTRKMRLDSVDIERLRDFATAFRGRGPEDLPCPL